MESEGEIKIPTMYLAKQRRKRVKNRVRRI